MIVQKDINNNGSLKVKDHHIMRRSRIVSINEFTVRELSSTLKSKKENKSIKWDKIYLSPCKVTCNTYLRFFQ